MINVAILASGEGDKTENILTHFNGNPNSEIRVSCVISNENGQVIKRLRRYTDFTKHVTDKYIEIDKILTEKMVHYIVLDNYSDKIPVNFCKKYQYRILNIHPSLLPKYGGKDMYGMKIHNEVKKNNDGLSGISVYFVNEEYANGLVIFQKKFKIYPTDTPETIMNKTKILEEKFYPKLIEKTILATYNKLFK